MRLMRLFFSFFSGFFASGFENETVVLQQASGNVATFNNSSTDRDIVLNRIILDGASIASNDTKGLVLSGSVQRIRFQNGRIRNMHFTALDINGASNPEIVDTVIEGTTHAQGAVVANSDSALFQRVTTQNNAGNGLNTANLGVTNLRVLQSIARNNTGVGFQLRGEPFVAANNLAHNNAIGIRVQGGTITSKVYNNTVADNTGNGLQIDVGATDTQVTNNIVFGNGAQIVNNGTGTIQTTNLITNPGFLGPGNYRVPAGSPAVNAGTPLTAAEVGTEALDGTARVQGTGIDIGAYELAEDLPAPTGLRATPWGALHFYPTP